MMFLIWTLLILVREIKKSVSVARNKTWKKPGEQSLICGYCEWCKKMLMSDAGGWIVTANKQRFVMMVKMVVALTNTVC